MPKNVVPQQTVQTAIPAPWTRVWMDYVNSSSFPSVSPPNVKTPRFATTGIPVHSMDAAKPSVVTTYSTKPAIWRVRRMPIVMTATPAPKMPVGNLVYVNTPWSKTAPARRVRRTEIVMTTTVVLLTPAYPAGCVPTNPIRCAPVKNVHPKQIVTTTTRVQTTCVSKADSVGTSCSPNVKCH